jgi:hypothetical protein
MYGLEWIYIYIYIWSCRWCVGDYKNYKQITRYPWLSSATK